MWNISDHHHPTLLGPPLSGYTSRVTDLAFSPDGHTLATSGDGVRLWNVTDPAHPAAIGQPLATSTAELTSLAYLPNSQTLATGGAGQHSSTVATGSGRKRPTDLYPHRHPDPLAVAEAPAHAPLPHQMRLRSNLNGSPLRRLPLSAFCGGGSMPM
ncbi:WD40 repeat domain-containing protein [Streptomyces sp. NPDC091265]|uniref:WD40 repeat domain-containing protein n=1 Tax=unclassified Streptomyces TaxID=2593676 RepID=UPI00344F2D98